MKKGFPYLSWLFVLTGLGMELGLCISQRRSAKKWGLVFPRMKPSIFAVYAFAIALCLVVYLCREKVYKIVLAACLCALGVFLWADSLKKVDLMEAIASAPVELEEQYAIGQVPEKQLYSDLPEEVKWV